MTESETAQCVALLKGAYPRQDVSEETARVYEMFLSDLPFAEGRAAVVEIVATSRFFPAIAEIREVVAETVSGAPALDEAWLEVQEAFRYVGADGRPGFSHPAIVATVNAIGWRTMCLSTTPGIERAAFRDFYKSARARSVRSANMTPLLTGGRNGGLLGE